MNQGPAPTGVLGWALGPSSAERLVAFRRLLALTFFFYTLAWMMDGHEWLTDAGFHASPAATRGFQVPLPLLPSWLVPVFAVVYLGSLAAVVVDIRARWFGWICLACLIYATYVDRLSAFSMNKIALMAWAVLLLAPWTTSEDGSPQLRSAWPLRILQGTLLVEYVGAGLCKLRGAWLDHGDVLLLTAQTIYMTDLAAWMVRHLPTWAWALMQHSSLAFELLAPFLLCIRRLRPIGFAWGLAMHLGIGLMMYRVGYFSAFIVAFYVLFVDEGTLVELRARFGRRAPAG